MNNNIKILIYNINILNNSDIYLRKTFAQLRHQKSTFNEIFVLYMYMAQSF